MAVPSRLVRAAVAAGLVVAVALGGSASAAERDRLLAGQTLSASQSLRSASGQYSLAMQSDGNLVLYAAGRALWSTRTTAAGSRAIMQADGNLVVYTPDDVATWSSGTAGHPGALLEVQNDGNVVLSVSGRAIWSSRTVNDRLTAGQTLVASYNLRSANGQYSLPMQADGNLVLYAAGRALWSTRTSAAGSRVVMQTDGNLVVYGPDDVARWSSGTAGNPGAFLAVQDDGNVVVYVGARAIWASRTVNDRLTPGQTLVASHYLRSATGPYQLRMQPDGNVVLYAATRALWSTRTSAAGSRVVMQTDGNLVVYGPDDVARWSSRTAGNSGALLAMRADGTVAIYVGAHVIWASGLPVVSGPPAPYGPPEWWPLRGDNLVGCARSSPGGICDGHHSAWAIDIEAPEGQAVYASGAGLAKVSSSSSACSGYGRSVVVEHGGATRSLYAHLSSFSAALTASPGGVMVDSSTIIGYIGHTGSVSNCSYNHLHYEETASGAFSGSATDPGPLKACTDGRLVSYPAEWGRSSWNGLPGHTYRGRSDGTQC